MLFKRHVVRVRSSLAAWHRLGGVMRRYLQGTLDYHCGIYCVINALSCVHNISLAAARTIYTETILSLAKHPAVFGALARNYTDHYWVVQYMLARWAAENPYRLKKYSPLGGWRGSIQDSFDCEALLHEPLLYSEKVSPYSALSSPDEQYYAQSAWTLIEDWLAPKDPHGSRRAAIFRFHRYLPSVETPLLSHWTVASTMRGEILFLHDACGEENAIHSIAQEDVLPEMNVPVSLKIVPESIILLERWHP